MKFNCVMVMQFLKLNVDLRIHLFSTRHYAKKLRISCSMPRPGMKARPFTSSPQGVILCRLSGAAFDGLEPNFFNIMIPRWELLNLRVAFKAPRK